MTPPASCFLHSIYGSEFSLVATRRISDCMDGAMEIFDVSGL